MSTYKPESAVLYDGNHGSGSIRKPRPYDLPITPFTSSQFHFEKGQFTAEASTLGIKPAAMPFVRLFSDACDVGIAIKSDKTGQVVRYYLKNIEWKYSTGTHVDDEVVAWHFRPVDRDCHNEGTRRTRVVILND